MDALEWVVIASIGIVIFLWGPNKIPEIARSISKARQQFREASKELQFLTKGRTPESFLDALAAPAAQVEGPLVAPEAPSANESRTADEILLENARELGIVTAGKTKEQILSEILAKNKGAA